MELRGIFLCYNCYIDISMGYDRIMTRDVFFLFYMIMFVYPPLFHHDYPHDYPDYNLQDDLCLADGWYRYRLGMWV